MNRTALTPFFAGALLLLSTGCASTTVIRTNPPGAVVRNLQGEKLGNTPYTFSGGGIINSTERFTLEMPGYEVGDITIRRSQINGLAMAAWGIAGIGGGLFFWPLLAASAGMLWAADFAPSYDIDLKPLSANETRATANQPAAAPKARHR